VDFKMPYNLREKLNLVKNKMEVWFTPTPIFLVWGWIILALIIGGLISVFSFREFIAKPEVGVIRISGPIFGQCQADEILEQIRYAKEKKEIKGVVLEIDSPGGEASVVEGIYLALLRLREEKPIVASINQRGASGGYYIALASNFIYAKPDSEIGSIGAWTSLPYPEMPSEDILPTGPFKDTGMTRQKAVGQLEMLRQSFLGVVLFHRGEKLKISADELTKAEVYTGIEGLGAGLIDEIGSNFDAIEKAADYAGIAHYQVVDIAGKMAEKVQTEKWGVTQPTTESKKELLPTYYYLIESR